MYDEATLQIPKDNIHRPTHYGHEREVGVRDRETNKMAAEAIGSTEARTLTYSVHAWTEPATVVFNDEAPSFNRLNRPHQSVKHSIGVYVRGMAHTNGIERLWSLLKRAYIEVYRHFSYKHLHREIAEATSRHNARSEPARRWHPRSCPVSASVYGTSI